MGIAMEVPAKILVADDAPDSVQLLEDLLTAAGYEVITAYDGEQALERALQERPNLVLLDVMMPKMDGFEVCRRLKQADHMRFTPVVLITILQDLEYKLHGLEAGADEFLSKPFNRLELLTRVRALLHTHTLTLELQHSYEELRRVENLRNDLMAMIAHDLRSPLTVILGTLEVLAEDFRDALTEEHTHAIEVAIGAARRQMRLIHNILDLQRLEEGKMPLNVAQVDLRSIILSAISDAGLQATWRDIQLTLDFPSGLPPVRADPALIERVLANVIDNALRYISNGGRVHISAGLLTGEEGMTFVVIRIADTGPGVPEADRWLIFDKFRQADKAEEGSRGTSGLGLAFCRMALEAQGGRIWVDSAPGWGAVFSFTLPIEEIGPAAAVEG